MVEVRDVTLKKKNNKPMVARRIRKPAMPMRPLCRPTYVLIAAVRTDLGRQSRYDVFFSRLYYSKLIFIRGTSLRRVVTFFFFFAFFRYTDRVHRS